MFHDALVYMLLNCLDRFLRNLMSNEDKIFGGKLVVLMGDFRQILPVVRGGHRPQIITATLKTSSLWTQVTTLSLKENMRVKRIMGENPSIEREAKYTNHAKWLLSIGGIPIGICSFHCRRRGLDAGICALVRNVHFYVHDFSST